MYTQRALHVRDSATKKGPVEVLLPVVVVIHPVAVQLKPQSPFAPSPTPRQSAVSVKPKSKQSKPANYSVPNSVVQKNPLYSPSSWTKQRKTTFQKPVSPTDPDILESRVVAHPRPGDFSAFQMQAVWIARPAGYIGRAHLRRLVVVLVVALGRYHPVYHSSRGLKIEQIQVVESRWEVYLLRRLVLQGNPRSIDWFVLVGRAG